MSKAKCTPGPWVVYYFPSEDTEDGNAETAIQCGADENGEEGATLATINRWSYGDDSPTEESEANARLIAAAPDLLSKCEMAEDICRTLYAEACADSKREYDSRLIQSLSLDLKDVIAKATGEDVPA